jgi:hypothetical protein
MEATEGITRSVFSRVVVIAAVHKVYRSYRCRRLRRRRRRRRRRRLRGGAVQGGKVTASCADCKGDSYEWV